MHPAAGVARSLSGGEAALSRATGGLPQKAGAYQTRFFQGLWSMGLREVVPGSEVTA